MKGNVLKDLTYLFIGGNRIQKLGIVAASAVIGLSMTDANYYLDPLHHPQTFLTNPWISVAFAALASFQMTEYFSQVCLLETLRRTFCLPESLKKT